MKAPFKYGDEFTVKDEHSYYNGWKFKVITCQMQHVFGTENETDWHVAAVRWVKTKKAWSASEILLRVDGGLVR